MWDRHESVGIVIPTYNNANYSIDCIQSIRKFTSNYRIIWVDNGSDDIERSYVNECFWDNRIPVTKIFNNENKGFIKATNQGIQTALDHNYKLIMIMNNDTVVRHQSWLAKMIDVFREKPKAGLVGPTTIFAESWQNRENLLKHWGPVETWPIMKKVDSMLAFFCTLIKPEVFKSVGLLDEQYGLGFGDDDAFCEDAKDAGYELYLRTDVTVPHYHRTTFKRYIPDWKERQQENIAKFKRNYGYR